MPTLFKYVYCTIIMVPYPSSSKIEQEFTFRTIKEIVDKNWNIYSENKLVIKV